MTIGPFLRGLAAAVLAGLLAAGVWVLFATPVDDPNGMSPRREARAEGPAFDSPEDCRPCHEAVFASWGVSRHAVAWTNPKLGIYADLSLGIDDCVHCHAPKPLFVTGPADLPVRRDPSRASGIDCLVCHAREEGVAASRTVPEAPCRPVFDPRLCDGSVCSSCHRTIALDFGEHPRAASGATCVDCHAAPGDEPWGLRVHDLRGGHDPGQVRKAFAMDVAVEGDEAVVAVRNVGAGHNFPGERHFRSLFLETEVRDGRGDVIRLFRRTIKDVSPIRRARRDADIRAGEEVRFRFPLHVDEGGVRATLFYKRYPDQLDGEALALGQAGSRFP